jgi:predicted DNA-binding protein (MmcQ/YjbR family)
MNIEQLRDYCLSKPGTIECFPFDENTLVFKVGEKMYALTDLEGQHSINLKCDPEKAIELREQYDFVLPGYHMSKVHWNTILIDGRVNDKLLCTWIDHSYDLVFNGLPKKIKDRGLEYYLSIFFRGYFLRHRQVLQYMGHFCFSNISMVL